MAGNKEHLLLDFEQATDGHSPYSLELLKSLGSLKLGRQLHETRPLERCLVIATSVPVANTVKAAPRAPCSNNGSQMESH